MQKYTRRPAFRTLGTRSKSQGVALLVAMVLLLALTMLAVSAMQGTLMQERMSVNQRDVAEAFHAAERALWTGEANLRNNPLNFIGILPLNNPMTWAPAPGDPDVISFGTALYHIAEAGVVCPPGGDLSSTCNDLYTITVHAVGRQPNTVTVLQTTFSVQP